MKNILTLSIILFSLSLSAQTATFSGPITTPSPKWYDISHYKPFTPKRITRNVLSIGTGILHGFSEAFHKDPHVYEKRWSVAPVSFFGSEQDLLQYDSNGKHKLDALNWTRDLHHLEGFTTKYVNGGVYLSIGLSKRKNPWKNVVLDCIINSALNTAAASITYSATTRSRLFYF